MLSFFKPKYEVTGVSPKVVGFFFAQYVQVMRHGHDRVDEKMKRYLYEVCLGLGVPLNDIEEVKPEEIAELPAPVEEERAPIIIHRRKFYGEYE